MKSIAQIKLEIANQLGCESWDCLLMNYHLKEHESFYDKVSRYYATEKVKETLKVAAERACTKLHKGRSGCKIVVDTESILSLETELIENINKEI